MQYRANWTTNSNPFAGDALEQEIADMEATIARNKAVFAVDGDLMDLKNRLDMSVIELRALKRAAELRPAG